MEIESLRDIRELPDLPPYGYGDSEKENVVTLVRVESRKPQAATIDIF